MRERLTSAGKKHRILIVDDVPANITVLVKALGEEYKLSVATSGKDALRIAVSEKPPDLILLDIMMPDMDGYEVLRRLKSDEKSAVIPVIFVTARSQETDEEWGLELGAADYISKPIRLPIVKARVKSQLARKRAVEAELALERLSAIADLASGVAHHFNNMLQVVMGGASVALMKVERGEVEDAKSMLRKIIESSRFGSETVRSLEDFVRMQTGAIGPDRVFDLSETILKVVQTSKKLCGLADSGTDINLIPELEEGCFVEGKESELLKVVANLVRNAVEAMPQGGDLRIKTFCHDNRVALQITDTGAGISGEHLGKIFEPFFTTKGYQRVGMGLPSSYGIVTDHGGTISVQSRQGQGSVFLVELPFAAEQPGSGEFELIPGVGPRLRTLIIDDVEPIVTMLSELLAELGQEVVYAFSGEQGLDIFQDQPIDLVICDLGMPGLNGWEVGRRIKNMCEAKGIPKVPFIILSGWGEQLNEEEKAVESGVDAVIAKPLDPSRLLGIIDALFKGKSP